MNPRKTSLDDPTPGPNPRVAFLMRGVLIICLLLIGYMLYEMKQVEKMNNQAVVLMKAEKYAEAIPLLEKARAVNKEDAHVLDSLSKAYLATEQWDKANATAQALLKIDPTHPDASKVVDRCMLQQKMKNETQKTQ
jgi:tetratricopeptide (TPR) repeat protein